MTSLDSAEYPSKLFETSQIEEEPSIGSDFQSCYDEYYKPLENKSDIEIENQLNSQATLPDGKPNLRLMKGLIYSILTNHDQAELSLTRIFRSIPSSRQSLCEVLNPLLIYEDFHKMNFYCRKQLVWVINQITGQVWNVEQLYHSLLRQIPACRTDPISVSFSNEVVELLFNQKEFILKTPLILTYSVYVLLCMINDHKNHSELQKKEIDLVLYFLKADFMTCISIGREFIRALHSILPIPEIADLWANMVILPQRIHSNFQGIQQILHIPTKQEILEIRISFKMANFIQYLLHSTTLENRSLHISLFKKILINEQEMEAFYPELIRYLVGHQSCQGSIKSDALTRYVLIVDLISQLNSLAIISNCQLSLVFDWLFYQPGADSAFNIEPAALIIYNSLNGHSYISNTLLEFLFDSAVHFYPHSSPPLQAGLVNGMRILCASGVIASLDPFFEFNIHPKLKKQIFETFNTFLSEKVLNTFDPNIVSNPVTPVRPPTPTHGSPSPGPPHTPTSEQFEGEPVWASDEQEAPNFSPTYDDFKDSNENYENESGSQSSEQSPDHHRSPQDTSPPKETLLNLEDESLVQYREHLEKLKSLTTNSDFTQASMIMGELIEKALKATEFKPSLIDSLSILIPDLTYVEVSKETIEKSEGQYISPEIEDVLTPIIQQTIEHMNNDEIFKKLTDLTWKLTSNSKHLSYRILIKLIRQSENISEAYQGFSKIISHWPQDFNQIIHTIFDDLCYISLELFDCLFPQFYRYIPECIGDLNLILIIIQNLNPFILNNLLSRLSSNRQVIFGHNFQSNLHDTLQWDSEYQESLWKLLSIECFGKLKSINGLLKEFLPYLIGPDALQESDLNLDCDIALRCLVPLITSVHPNFDTIEQLFLLSSVMMGSGTHMVLGDVLSIWSRNCDQMLVKPLQKLFNQVIDFTDFNESEHPILENIFSFSYIIYEWWNMYYLNEVILGNISDNAKGNIISILNIQALLKKIISKYNLDNNYFPSLFVEN